MTTVGSIVGSRYRLEQRVAQGGMGDVWKATHLSLLCPVAIKFMRPGAGDERFLREARIAAAIRHPNVVAVIDEGVTEDGRMFLVMEYLDGLSLALRLSQAPALTVREVCHVMNQVLRALHAVHIKGIVHRDLKPDNVFLLKDEEGEGRAHVKLLDFGVAHACLSSALALPVAHLTVTGCTVGTPWYMAPEQARGLQVGPASDVFSVGVMLYRCITGRFPFEGATLADIVLKLMTTPAIPPHEYRPELPESLSGVILRALAVAPEDRFADAHAMRRALEACVLPDAPAALLERPEPLPAEECSVSMGGFLEVTPPPEVDLAVMPAEPLPLSTLPETPATGLPVRGTRKPLIASVAVPARARKSMLKPLTAGLAFAAAAALVASPWTKRKPQPLVIAAAAEDSPVASATTPPAAAQVAAPAVEQVVEATRLPTTAKVGVPARRALRPFRSPGF